MADSGNDDDADDNEAQELEEEQEEEKDVGVVDLPAVSTGWSIDATGEALTFLVP